ncbi:hypothetical protein L596_003746 [Steinernema carpocapsae]|uniref:Uncharacterized protein n=1 Tax=Steinernema carpocapsae TaxID=34508 RepID=A0A4U8UTI7_STECR|nr:hypothetical protein L596_003746 [Steinernema carpocapsae]
MDQTPNERNTSSLHNISLQLDIISQRGVQDKLHGSHVQMCRYRISRVLPLGLSDNTFPLARFTEKILIPSSARRSRGG